MSQINETKYPNADTSPERLELIQKWYSQCKETGHWDFSTKPIGDLLAMLEEHAARIEYLEETIAGFHDQPENVDDDDNIIF